MYKLIFLGLIAIGLLLYFSGALEFDNSDESVRITVDKEKTKELGESIKDQLEDQ